MQDEPSDAAVEGDHSGDPGTGWTERPVGPLAAPRRHRRRTDWRLGGRAVSRWDTSVLVSAAVGGGIGVLAAVLVARISAPWAPTVSLLALWAGLLGAVVWAFIRARPAGILTFRPTDLVWGLGVGLGLRLLQGLSSDANSAPFPSSASFSGILSAGNVPDFFTAGFAGPVIEEFFFRAVLLIALYQLFRRSLGHVAAGVTAAFTSAGAFICLHAAFGALTLSDGLQLFLVGVACSGLVIMTGRIWGAVLAHIVYNVSFVLLGVLGTALA